MNPTVMIALILGAHAAFLWSASRRWQMLKLGRHIDRLDRIPARIGAVLRYAFKQEKMDYYQPAGWAHKLIFFGFIVLLLRTLILWGRGIDPSFNLFFLSPTSSIGKVYEFAKDLVGMGVIVGVLVFAYFRLIRPQKRMTLSGEALLILGIIFTMMIADMSYDGSALVLASRQGEMCAPGSHLATAEQCSKLATVIAPYGMGTEVYTTWRFFPSPAGSLFAMLFRNFSAGTLLTIAQVGFWTHSTLVLTFLNILPHSKHFHVITAIPNVFLKDLDPPGRLKPMAPSAEALGELMLAASELPEPTEAPIGLARVSHLTWKSILDFYTCTECGRCSDNCPAHRTGKILSPKHLTLALRDHMYQHESALIETEMAWPPKHPSKQADPEHHAPETAAIAREGARQPNLYVPIDLIPNIVHPDVLWACTTCRACEEQCPVLISYVDKIIDMRRNLMMIKNEFPETLQKPFQAMEVNGNPWNLSRIDRAAWSDGLEIPTMADHPTAEVLYWVGCAASYDDRAKKIARSVAKLLKAAKVDFAILAQEENCTGDPARRAGNEFLFAQLAEGNAATLNGYKEKGGMRTVVTACPHCFNTLKNEYPDFGATLDVVHHSEFLTRLLAEKRLVPKKSVEGTVTYHDSCYLGRYNGVYESPRDVLRSIPGIDLVEPEYWTKQRGLCCGAGGAQMWMEEQNTNRVNVKRTLQLVDTLQQRPGATSTIASACPFCMTMLTDGLKAHGLEEKVRQRDIAEVLEESCALDEVTATPGNPEIDAPTPAEPKAETETQASAE